jgi:hypothetical protein
MTAADAARLDGLTAKQDAINERQQAEVKDWARVTSIILVLFATRSLAVSLILSEQLRVISNELLPCGLFTMIYGGGWVILSGNAVARFWVILFAMIVAGHYASRLSAIQASNSRSAVSSSSRRRRDLGEPAFRA